MSTINTNSINVNYPVPGVNNNSQGFRDNFASIKTNLDEAGTELTDLQNKVVVKQALTGATLNNDMANTLISNALTRSFRASTYNLGGALSGTVLVDVSLGDVQYGTIAANSNITLQFGSWSPTGTQSNVQLRLNVNDSNSYINFTGTNVDTTKAELENYSSSSNTVFAPYSVTQLDYCFSTTDCGNTIAVEPTNRPQKATQITTRTPANVGLRGDVAGTMCADATYLYVCTGTYNGSTAIWKRITLNAF